MSKLAAIGALRPKPLGAPLFLIHATRALRQAQQARGCVWAGTQFCEGYAFSLSVWDSPADMKRYARSGRHARAMRWSWATGEVFRFHHFAVDEVPPWDEAIGRWKSMMATA